MWLNINLWLKKHKQIRKENMTDVQTDFINVSEMTNAEAD